MKGSNFKANYIREIISNQIKIKEEIKNKMKIDENNTKKLCFLDADGKQSLKDGFFISGQQF